MVGGGVWVCVWVCGGRAGLGGGFGLGGSLMFCKLTKIFSQNVYHGNHTSFFKLKFCLCVQSMALGTRTNFQLEICNINVIYGTVYFHKIILKGSQNISETTTWLLLWPVIDCAGKWGPGFGQGKNFLPAPSNFGEMVEKIYIFSCFLWTIQHQKS